MATDNFSTEQADVKERPIIFNDPMVRAILEGRKTQTRRPVKGLIKRQKRGGWIDAHDPYQDSIGNWYFTDNGLPLGPFPCPYGKPGDLLWVRESFWVEHDTDLVNDRLADCGIDLKEDNLWARVWYCSTDSDPIKTEPYISFYSKHPSVHMPRWASRITLEITAVRVEQVQDISNADAIAEGIHKNSRGFWTPGGYAEGGETLAFRDLWDSIYAAKDLGWKTNPWVWVIEFKRVQ